METEDKLIIFGISLVLVVVAVLLLNPFVIVNAGEKGVVMNWGAVSERVLNEGLHILVPIQQSVKKINIKTLKVETQVAAYSRDAQTVETKIALNYHLQGDKANKIYQEIGDNKAVEDTIVNPLIQETVKLIMARFTAQELLEARASVTEQIISALSSQLQKNNISVDGFSLMNFSFSEQYEKAVEAKQVAQQQALKAENDLKRIKMEAEQRIAQAEAEAKAIEAQTRAITSQGGKEYIQLKAIEQWNGSLPNQMVPGAALPFIDLSD